MTRAVYGSFSCDPVSVLSILTVHVVVVISSIDTVLPDDVWLPEPEVEMSVYFPVVCSTEKETLKTPLSTRSTDNTLYDDRIFASPSKDT